MRFPGAGVHRAATTGNWPSSPRPSDCWPNSRSAPSRSTTWTGARASPPTFYVEDDVLLTLLDRAVAEADAAMTRVETARRAATDPDDVPRELWRQAISACADTFRRHRGLTLAWAEARSTNAEVRAMWATVFEGWVQRSAAAMESERARGAAPSGIPARDLAVALNSMNERVRYATSSGDGPAVAEDDVVDVLLQIWLGAVYGPPRTA